jgi:hypothetical protein
VFAATRPGAERSSGQGARLLGNAGAAEAGGQKRDSRPLKEALRVGVERVTSKVGAVDGFNRDPAIHIPLPAQLRTVQEGLRKVGMSSMADDLETRMNRAAEMAAGEAKPLLWNAIQEMTLDDAQRIFNGPKDAATRYFRAR